MKRIRLTLLWLSLATHALIAQNADSLLKSDPDKLRSYESKAKSKAAAIMLAWLLPSAGHSYAGNWSRGMSFVAGEVGGIVLFIVGTERGFHPSQGECTGLDRSISRRRYTNLGVFRCRLGGREIQRQTI